MRDDFCAFILTHGRPDRVYTVNTLKTSGYTGRMFFVVDDEDKQLAAYKDKFGAENVLVISKSEEAKHFDEGDNFGDRRAIIYARNACFRLAREVGCKYFIELDDDYTNFSYRFSDEMTYVPRTIKGIDDVFSALVDFLEATPFASVAMAQGGDWIGGSNNGTDEGTISALRKAMNTFVCSTDRPFSFFGRLNEDVNLYTCAQRRGLPLLTIRGLTITQKQTQSNAGGMTETYLLSGTYVKSFYSVMYAPSCVRVSRLGDRGQPRLHHQVTWDATAPKIVSAKHRLNRSP